MEIVARGDIHDMLDESARVGCGETIDGFVDDDLAIVAPWGFDVSAITVPVAVWYGVNDTLVPASHGEWLARTIPGATVVPLDGGHFAIYDRLGELLSWLRNRADPCADRHSRLAGGGERRPASRDARHVLAEALEPWRDVPPTGLTGPSFALTRRLTAPSRRG